MKKKHLLLLHLILFFYSFGGIFAKLASGEKMFSLSFLFYYGIVLGNLVFYAIVWQQIIKVMPLTTAFANKAVTILWGMLWGKVVFQEEITLQMLLGAVVILCGVCLVVTSEEESGEKPEESGEKS